MINANELRIGSLYLNNGKVEAVHKQTIEWLCVGGCEDVDPIPLTEEWLLRAGFEFWDYEDTDDDLIKCFKIHYTNPIVKTVYFSVDIISSKEDVDNIQIDFIKYSPACEGGMILTDIDYVHDLQNLYFALTGKELEFNLNDK